MQAISEVDVFLMEREHEMTAPVEMQRMVKSFLHKFQDTTLAHRIEVILEAKVVRLLVAANHGANKEEMKAVYEAFEKAYSEFSLEATSVRLYTQISIAFPSRSTSSNTSP